MFFAYGNLLKQYLVSVQKVIGKRILFIKSISCHETNFCSACVYFHGKWFLMSFRFLYFRSCSVGEVFHQVFGEELVQEGLLNSLLPFLIPCKKQQCGSGLPSSSMSNAASSGNRKFILLLV